MTFWQWLNSGIPLGDDRDILARIGFRFVWCTGPYILLAYLLSAFGVTTMLSSWPALVVLSIPIIGGVADWIRLRLRSEPAPHTPA